MRITNNMMSRNLMRNIYSNYNRVMKHHLQVTTGKAFQNMSESPHEAAVLADLKHKLGRNDRYMDNVSRTLGVIKENEGGLTAINNSLSEINELVNSGISGTNGKDERQIIALVIEAHKENIISQLNMEFSGKYIFGGLNTSVSPIKNEEGVLTYNGIDITGMTKESCADFLADSIEIELSEGIKFDSSFSALKVTGYGQDNLLSVLDRIINELKSDDFNADNLIAEGKLNEEYLTKVQTLMSEVGGKISRLEVMEKKLADKELNMKTIITEVEGVDIEQAVIDFKTAEMIYNAALLTSAKIIQPTLLDYLR